MRPLLLMTLLVSVACDEGPSGPSALRFDRTLAKVQCQTEIGFKDAPCLTYGAASHTDFVDSGRVVFKTDGTVEWMLSTHKYQCPCYLGGCNTPCYHDAPTISVRSGTYTAAGDSIVLQFDEGDPATRTLKSSTPFPSRSIGWAGPESLRCVGCGVFYLVWFKTS